MTSATNGRVAASPGVAPTPLPPQAQTASTSIVQLAAASLVSASPGHQSAELKRSQRLKEEIDRLKSSIPATAAPIAATTTTTATIATTTTTAPPGSATTSRREALRRRGQFAARPAPLASLDCSITISSRTDQNNSNNSGSSSVDASTSSLSGYFECDELSDMVDDSLFELTNAGCLSRSVFPRDSAPAARAPSGPGRGDELEDGERTPTNRRLAPHDKISLEKQQNDTEAAGAISPSPSTSSSSASVSSPAVIARDNQGARGNKARDRAQTRRKATRSAAPAPPTTKTSAPPIAAEIAQRPATAAAGNSSGQDGGRRAEAQARRREAKQAPRRPGRSQSNSMAAVEGPRAVNSRCPICCEQAAAGGQSNQPAGQRAAGSGAKKAAPGHRKRRFTFSLFNLFTGGGGGGGGGGPRVGGDQDAGAAPRQATQNDDDGDDEMSPPRRSHLATCQHDLAQDPIRLTALSGRGASGGGTGSLGIASEAAKPSARRSRQLAGAKRGEESHAPAAADRSLLPVRLRDSIKITNQRKARRQVAKPAAAAVASGKAPPNSKHAGNGHAPAPSDGELLLDLLTSGAGGSASGVRARAASENGQQAGVAARSKCVKFSTPDRVLILSPTPPASQRSGSSSSRYARLPASASTTALASSSCEPPASIIKRSVPKSSSYSQTESNRGLDELLARYERDTQLVAKINEKLKLTETIASNRAALDSSDEEREEEEEEHAEGTGRAEKLSGRDDASELRDDIDEELLEVVQRQLALTTSESGESPAQEEADFSRCDCSGRAPANKGRPTLALEADQIKRARDNEAGAALTGAIARTAPGSPASSGGGGADHADRSKLISDLACARENMIPANGRRPADPNAENNQIYDARHSSPLDHRPPQASHRLALARTSEGSERDGNADAAADRCDAASGNDDGDGTRLSREWLGKQARAFV